MDKIIYDSRRVFWPANAPAKSIPIEIKSTGQISSATNVQEAVQMLTTDISGAIGNLPDNLDETNTTTLRSTIRCVNEILNALRGLQNISNPNE